MSRINKKSGVVGDPLTILIDPRFYNHTAAINYFSDAALTTPVAPTAGTVAVTGRIPGAGGYSIFDASPIDSTDVSDSASSGVPLDSVICTPTGITGNSVTHYTITIISTEG